jgi:ubiquinone/menaquinone biosynthesis C-methylase UbiE
MTSCDRQLLACCAEIYGHPLARWLLGDSMHPGGLALTGRLAGLLDLGPHSRVLDLGAGRGATAVHLARTLGCPVVGVTPEASGVAAGREMARQQGVVGLVEFVQSDWSQAPLREGSFDIVLAECVLSILPDKEAALQRCHSLLREGGRLGLSDVTVNGPLPPELDGILANAGCLGGALALEQYTQLVETAGFEVDSCQDLPKVAAGFLREISGKLLMAEAAAGLGKLPLNSGVLDEAKRVLSALRGAVDGGVLSYGLLVAHRESSK